ncbi:MAG: hypothetical protein EBU90_09580 [Proteobacteria bacterium]|nr:hypothetical protein [Pseudomonadota bacterium]NBP14385.1 hypothetical protein [bacterium]
MNKKFLLLIASIVMSSIGAAEQRLILKEENFQEVRYVVTQEGAVITYVYKKKNKGYCSFVKYNPGTPVIGIISKGKESERGFDFFEHLWLEQESANWCNISKHSHQGITIYQAMQNGKPGHEILAIYNKPEDKRDCWELVKGHKLQLTREKEKKVFRLLSQRYQKEQKNKE